MAAGLQARVYDPLWLLSRQWQVGEFQGEDNGSPAAACWRGEISPLSRFHAGPLSGSTEGRRFDSRSTPLETVVERERVRPDPAHPEKAAEAAGTTVLRAENLQAGDPIPGIGASKEFTDATAALRKGEVMAGPVVLPDGKAVIATVTDVQPAHPSTFEEARAEAKTKASADKEQAFRFGASTKF